jgi:KUP system potassium uptake protein
MEGQIYIPEVNYLLMFACVALVLTFKTSTNLAAAYGIAVTGTMAITSFLYFLVCRHNWNYSWSKALAIFVPFVIIDLTFFSSNATKIVDGGWFPLLVAAFVFTGMTTWRRGRELLSAKLREGALSPELFIQSLRARPPIRVPGTAVFMTSDPEGAPPVLLHHLKHNKVLHEKVILLSIQGEEIPQVADRDRVEFKELGSGFYQVMASYGFMESPDVPAVLQALSLKGDAMDLGGLTVKVMETTFYLGRETLIPSGTARMAGWRKRLFIIMTRNAQSATAFFNLPPNRVVEMGAQIQL